jgi:NADH/F420H2 dehydrogenase subunit C
MADAPANPPSSNDADPTKPAGSRPPVAPSGSAGGPPAPVPGVGQGAGVGGASPLPPASSVVPVAPVQPPGGTTPPPPPAGPPNVAAPAPAAPPQPPPAGPPADDPLVVAMNALGAELLPPTQDGLPAFRVERDEWLDVAREMKRQPALSFEMLLDVAGVDFPKRRPRFDVVYHLWSLTHNKVVRVKVGAPEEDPVVPSVVELWPTADWHERETFDLFGVKFGGHPDLRRILMPDDYPWHPLRKDFPVEGIDNAVSYLRAGGVLMTREIDVDRPPGQDRTPVDLSRGDPPGFTDRADEVRTGVTP